jgi:pimeloyl-ACP methyl ester carboxylesterase
VIEWGARNGTFLTKGFMRLGALLTTMLVTASGMSVATASAATARPSCSDRGEGSSPVNGLVKQAHPVVLVHGWNGAPMQPTRALLEGKLPQGWQFLLFDYSAVNDHWAARPEVAACLAHYLEDVSNAHRDVGGDGRVYVVAHSMGGLATSYAANSEYGGSEALGEHLGGLITIDTPWTGSPWGGTGWAELVQKLVHIRLPRAGTDAWDCLRKLGPHGSGGCSTPAYMPLSVPVTQLAGEVTIRRSFFGLHAYDIVLGSDGIVPTDSQHGYLDSAPGSPLGLHTSTTSVKCSEDMDSLLARGAASLGGRASGTIGQILGALVGTEGQLLADGKAMDAIGSNQPSWALIELLVRTQLASVCSHINMPTTPMAIDKMVTALRELAAPQRLIPTDLLSAPVPAYCQHAAGRLVNGRLPLKRTADGGDVGFATVLRGFGDEKVSGFNIQPLIIDLTADGTRELAGVLSCSAGGVTWPDMVLTYSSSFKGPILLGSLSLGDVTAHEHSDVTSLRVNGGRLTVKWTSYDGCCIEPRDWTATLRWNGKKLIAQNLKQLAGPPEESSIPDL